MPNTIKKGSKIVVVEGAKQGELGIVTKVAKKYDEADRIYRWTVWAESLDGGHRIKTRLSWVREL